MTWLGHTTGYPFRISLPVYQTATIAQTIFHQTKSDFTLGLRTGFLQIEPYFSDNVILFFTNEPYRVG